MPRRARVRVAGIPLHIIQRGNNRGACFFSDVDRQFYLHHLGRLADQFCCAIHAYVLMTNHVHLLLTPEDAVGASLTMKNLGQQYVQYVNRVHGRSGSLWEGRYRASLVQTEAYLLGCHRYIEMNPVRAAMAAQPGEYRWSSFAGNAHGLIDPLLTPHAEYLRLGADGPARQRAYRALFRATANEAELAEIRKATNAGYALGSQRFIAEIERITGRRAREGVTGRPASAPRVETG